MQVKLGAFYSLYSKGKNSNTASPPSKSYQWKESNALEPNWVIAAETYPGFCSMKRLEVLLFPRTNDKHGKITVKMTKSQLRYKKKHN